jgi:hypothetical protein
MTAARQMALRRSMGMLERQKHALGDIMRMSEKCRAGHVLPQQQPASFRDALAAGLRLRQQRSHAHRGSYSAWCGACTRTSPQSYSCAGMSRDRRRGGRDARYLRRLNLLQVNRDRSEWRRPAPTSVEAIRLSLLGAGDDSNHGAILSGDGAVAAGRQRQNHPGGIWKSAAT